jgi:hypothetical protein
MRPIERLVEKNIFVEVFVRLLLTPGTSRAYETFLSFTSTAA